MQEIYCRFYKKNTAFGRVKSLGAKYSAFNPEYVMNVVEELNPLIRAWAENQNLTFIDAERDIEKNSTSMIMMKEIFKLEEAKVIVSIKDQYILDLKVEFKRQDFNEEAKNFELYIEKLLDDFPTLELDKMERV